MDATAPAALRASLHGIIEDHHRIPYTSSETDTWDVLELADQDPNDPGRIVTVYRNASFPRRGGGNEAYNREHTWPRSFGFPDNDSSLNYPFTDLHHLFLADVDYNFQRSNKPFQDCDDQCQEWPTQANAGRGGEAGAWPGDSNWTEGEFTFGRWQVWADRRGDIARAMMYMDLRYEGGTHGLTGAAEPDLRLTNDRDLIESARTGQNEPVAWMGILDDLLRWHAQDPVDAVEVRHHEAVFAAQGNRNPFIDRPGWADCVYGGVCGFRINAGLNDAWFHSDTPGQGFFIIVFPERRQIFLAWFTYDTVRPASSADASLGEAGHRWLTAQGSYEGDTAVLDVLLTAGGVFDTSLPAPVTGDPIGSLTLVWEDCENATVNYQLDSPELSGEIPLKRIALDNAALCRALSGD